MSRTHNAGFLPATCISLFILAYASNAFSQTQSQTTAEKKKTDSTFAERTVRTGDSIPQPLAWFGSIDTRTSFEANATDVQPTSVLAPGSLTKQDRYGVRYHSLSELLARGTMYMPLSHGGFGQHDGISILGGQNADVAMSLNGRLVASPWSMQLPMTYVAPEALETSEILTGVHAIGLGGSLSLSSINLRDMQHNTATPYTSMWYSQGGGDVIAADVSFSQNVAPGLNITFGVRRSGANGRYFNTEYDVWNVRAAIRYTMDTLNHFGFSYGLTSHNTGLWGGLRTVLPLNQFTERTAPVVFFELRDEARRHDYTLSYTHLFDTAQRHSITAQVYASTDDMLRLRDSTLFVASWDSTTHMEFHGVHVGALIKSKHQFGNIGVNIGVGADVLDADQSVYSQQVSEVRPQVFAHVALPITSSLTTFLAGRITTANEEVLIGAGAGITLSGNGQSVTIDASSAQRAPSAAELGPSTVGLLPGPERSTVLSLTAASQRRNFNIQSQAFYRITTDPLVTIANRDANQFVSTTTTINGASSTVAGLNVLATISLFTPSENDTTEQGISHDWSMELRPVVRSYIEPNATDSTRRFPMIYGELSVAAVYSTGSNSVRLGVTASAVSPMASQQYIPLTWTYAAPTSSLDWTVNGMDVYLLAMLGNASVRLAYENFLAQRWQTTSIAPYIIRDIRLSVTWSFFD